jgi:Spy/CpxP family protein refolding chaperone
MKKTLWIALGVTGLVLAAGAAYAMGHGMGGPRMMKSMISARIADAEDYIDATPQQRQVIETAKTNIFSAMDAQGQSRKAVHQQIAGLLAADTFDVNQANALVDSQVDKARDFAHVVVAQVATVHAALTPDQRAKLIARFKEMHGRHGPQGGFGGPPQE